jgi:hypothetical protein
MRFCKTTLWIEKSPFVCNDIALTTFCSPVTCGVAIRHGGVTLRLSGAGCFVW